MGAGAQAGIRRVQGAGGAVGKPMGAGASGRASKNPTDAQEADGQAKKPTGTGAVRGGGLRRARGSGTMAVWRICFTRR